MAKTERGGRGAVGPLDLAFNGLSGLRWWCWLPLLVGPAAVGLVYLAHTMGWSGLLHKGVHETAAIVLMSATTAVLIVRVLAAGVSVGELGLWLALWGAAVFPAACLLDYRHHHKLAGLATSGAVEAFFGAMIVPGLALAIWALNRLRSREPALVVMVLIAATFLLRELHFQGTHKGVYVSVLVIGAWVWTWRESIDAPLAIGWRKPMLIMTAAAYALSVVIARGGLRLTPLPLDEGMSTWLEETTENAAHVMLLATAFADLWARPGTGAGAGPSSRRDGGEPR